MISKEIKDINTPATPSAGTSTPVDKLNTSYRFSQSNPVKQAKVKKGATLKCIATQEGKDRDSVTQPNSGANCE